MPCHRNPDTLNERLIFMPFPKQPPVQLIWQSTKLIIRGLCVCQERQNFFLMIYILEKVFFSCLSKQESVARQRSKEASTVTPRNACQLTDCQYITSSNKRICFWHQSVIPVSLTINGMLLLKRVIISSRIFLFKDAHHYSE